ncbi:serine threonine protein kinase [Ceratocystis lukuohia]|uniref:Serine threonine protein kinase n=1 Tax=Ceratocystis lukuohia TaxID=2019550 RepID=A0ABR4MG44_9PEZI
MESRQIFVALYDRGYLSRGHQRQVQGLMAYHWGILVKPEQGKEERYWSFEATDDNVLDETTYICNNPTGDWWFKHMLEDDPTRGSRLILQVKIGHTREGLLFEHMKSILETVPLPLRHQAEQQSCVTWVENAISTLQSYGCVLEFGIPQFMEQAIDNADRCMEDGQRNISVEYSLVPTAEPRDASVSSVI